MKIDIFFEDFAMQEQEIVYKMQIERNVYNETRKVFVNTHQFCYLPSRVFSKFYLPWKTTCLKGLQNFVVPLYKFPPAYIYS